MVRARTETGRSTLMKIFSIPWNDRPSSQHKWCSIKILSSWNARKIISIAVVSIGNQLFSMKFFMEGGGLYNFTTKQRKKSFRVSLLWGQRQIAKPIYPLPCRSKKSRKKFRVTHRGTESSPSKNGGGISFSHWHLKKIFDGVRIRAEKLKNLNFVIWCFCHRSKP